MRNRFALFLVSFCCLCLMLNARPVGAQATDEAFRADIRKFLELTGATKTGTQMAGLVVNSVFAGFKQANPEIPDRAIESVKDVLNKEFSRMFEGPDGLMEKMVAIYEKHFTRDDVKAMIAFYSSDAGKKVVSELPGLVQESAALGQEWTMKNMPRIQAAIEEKLRAEGFIK